jgi:hypothetical protein
MTMAGLCHDDEASVHKPGPKKVKPWCPIDVIAFTKELNQSRDYRAME